MHQTDTLFHKPKVVVGFMFGGEADNHAINTVPKETLVRITKVEPGGLDGKGIWTPATTGLTPAKENEDITKYLSGAFVKTENIHANGEADLQHTLNVLTLPGVPLNVEASDQLKQDLFFRYNQTLQEFFNGAAELETEFE